jgi:DnaD/phage-associated family protein
MRTFSGFPAGKVRNASLPEPVFTDLIPLIDDLAELKVTLHALWRLGQQRGKVRYLRCADLAADQTLLSGLGDDPATALNAALARAVERGTLLKAQAATCLPASACAGTPADRQAGAGGRRQVGEATEELYFVNTARGRAAVEAIARGEWPGEIEPATRPNVFTLYEQNVGLLTPLIADELREAEHEYPADWIEDAFREAVTLNKRSWKYIRAILERWRTEGRADEASRKSRKGDRRRYIEGEYGEYIEH